MPLLDCLVKIGVPKPMQDFIIAKKELHIKNGLDESAAEKQAVQDFKNETVNSLADLHSQIGNGRFKIPDNTHESSITDVGVSKASEPTEKIKTEGPIQSTEPVAEAVKEIPLTGDAANGITHAANEVRRQTRLEPGYEKTPETFEKWNNEAEELVKNGYDVEWLMDKIKEGHDPNPVENAIRKIYIATLDAEIAKKPTDELLAKQKRFIEIGDLANSRAGKNLVSLKGVNSPLNSISDFYVAKMQALNVDKLPEGTKAEIRKQYEDIQQKTKVAEEKLAAYEAEIARLKAEKEVRKLVKTKSKSKPKTHDEFVKDRESIIKAAKDRMDKARENAKNIKQQGIGGRTYADDLITIAPEVLKLVRSYVEEGVIKLADVVSNIHGQLKHDIPQLQEKDIHDIIAGEYNKKQKTKSQLQLALKDLQDEAKLINKLDALENGEVPKTNNAEIERNQKIKDLRDKIKSIKSEESESKKFYNEDVSDDAKKLISIKRINLKKAQDIREKLNKGEFEKEPKSNFLEDQEMKKKYPKLYKETMDAILAKENAKHDFEVGVLKDAMAKRGKGEKFFDGVKDVIGTMKALRAGIDFSALMIQNIVPILSHPIDNAPNVAKSFQHAFNAKSFERSLAEIHNSKYWDLIKKSGLDVTEPKSVEAKNKEEAFNRNLLEKDFEIKGKKYNIGKYTSAPFERAFTSLGNNIRVSAFLKMAEKLEADGHTFESNPKVFKDAAKLFNTQTGRGTLPEFIERSSEIVNTGIWSPKLMASRLNSLGLGDIVNPIFAKRPGFYRSLGEKGKVLSGLQKRASLDMVKFVSAVVGVYATAAFFFGAKPDLDPTSVTFGDIKEADGPKSYNMFGGFSQYIKLAAIMALGQRQSGNKTEDITDAKGKSRADLALKFLRGKTTPAAGVAIDLAGKKDYMGKPIDVKDELLSLVTPLSMTGIPEDMNRDGVVKAFANGLISMTGINVKDERDYDKLSSYTKEDYEDPSLKYFIDKGIDLPRDNSKTKTIKDQEEGKEKKISDYGEEKVKQYKDLRTKYLKETLSSIQDRGKVYVDRYGHASLSYDGEEKKERKEFSELTKSQLKEILSIASGKATQKAADELFKKEK